MVSEYSLESKTANDEEKSAEKLKKYLLNRRGRK
jgi:hypothetical protein